MQTWIVLGLMCVATVLNVIGCFKNRKIRRNLRDALNEANELCENSLQVPSNEAYYVIKSGPLFLMEHPIGYSWTFTEKASLAQKYTDPSWAIDTANQCNGNVVKYGPIDEVSLNLKR